MAEILGVVASGIAAAQATQTVCGVILSLSRLWREVKDVPEAIQNILDDLELAGEVVGAIEAELAFCSTITSQYGDSDGPRSPLQSLAVQRCRQIHRDLGHLADSLSADISSSRRRKSVLAKGKVVLKKDTLEKYERRLDKALGFLNFVVQIHTYHVS